MFFKSLVKVLNSTYNSVNNSRGYDNVNPQIVKYFKIEYGTDWKIALEHHLYKESQKNDKKAA